MTNLVPVPIREQIKARIDKLGLTQKELEDKLKANGSTIGQSNLSYFLSGKRNFSTDKLEELAEVLNTEWILKDK
jgi:transcriptional regulator with XRE-family HTH domain